MKTYDAKNATNEWSIEIDDDFYMLNLLNEKGAFVKAEDVSRRGERALVALALESGATHVRCAYDLVKTQ